MRLRFSTRFSGLILPCHVAISKKQNQGRSCVLAPQPATRMRSLRSATARPTTLLFLRRHLSAVPEPPPSDKKKHDDPMVDQAVQLFQNSEETWAIAELNNLLFASESPSSPQSLYRITRSLGCTVKAIKFLEFIRTNSPQECALQFQSSAFQAATELASNEFGSRDGLSGLYIFARESGGSLTVNAASNLLQSLGRAGMLEEMVSLFRSIDSNMKNTHVCNAYMNELLKSGRVGDALKVLDEMLEPNSKCAPSSLTGEIVFSSLWKLLRHQDSVREDQIADLVLKLGKNDIFLDSENISWLMSRLCWCRKSEKAWEILQEMFSLGFPVDASACNALLTGLEKHGNINRVNEVLAKMKEMNVEPSVVTFGILINHLCKSHRLNNALEILDKVCGGDIDGVSIKPDVVIFNTVINGLCKVGRQDQGLGLLERMRTHSCIPNIVTYNCLIDGYCKSSEIEKALELLNQMKGEGIQPNAITFSTLVDGMCKNGRINSALKLVQGMKVEGLIPKLKCYTSLISAFCGANNISKAMELFNEMCELGIKADAVVYYTLIFGLMQSGKLNDASHVMMKLKEAGFSLDTATYNVMISGFCKRNKVDEVYELLKDMNEAKIVPDVITYNTIISYFSRKGDFETADRMVYKMVKKGLYPTVATYGALINGRCLNGDLDVAMEMFREMESTSSRVKPNTVIYNILIGSLCKKTKLEDALSLMDDMIKKGVRPNSNTFNALFKCLQENNMLKKALSLMDRMTEEACKPDYITLEILTEWLSSLGESKKLERFVQGYRVSTA